MNNFTIFIYLAEVSGSLKGIANILSAILGLTTFVTTFGWCVTLDDKETNQVISKILRFIIPAFIVMVLITVLSPTQRTVYMMAASEVGEDVVKSPVAQDMFNDLRTIIRGYAKETSKETTEATK